MGFRGSPKPEGAWPPTSRGRLKRLAGIQPSPFKEEAPMRTALPLGIVLGLAMLGTGCGGTLQLIPTVVVSENEEGDRIIMKKSGFIINLRHKPSDILDIAWAAVNNYKDDLNDRYTDGKIKKSYFEEKIKEIDELAMEVGNRIGKKGGWLSGMSDEERSEKEAKAIIEIWDRLKKIKE